MTHRIFHSQKMVYVKEIEYSAKRVFSYTFRKDKDLFKRMLEFPQINYLKNEKLLVSSADSYILEYLELNNNGEFRIIRSGLYEREVRGVLEKQGKSESKIEVPKFKLIYRAELKRIRYDE